MKILIFFFVIVFHSVSFADEIEMVTDRPGQTESSNIVEPGWIQVETGVVYTLDSYENTDTEVLNLATTLFRIGVVENAELRFAFQYTSLTEKVVGKSKTIEGLEGVCIGTKIHIVDEDGLIPKTAFLFNTELPVGSKKLRVDEVTPVFRLIFEKTINDNFGIGSNLGTEWNSGIPVFIYSLALGYNVSDRIGIFFEYFGNASKSAKANHLIDGGVTYNIYNNLQLDASFGYAITEWTDDCFLNAGISLRLPK